MKKLMFAVTAAFCGAAFASEIASANVVGYTQKMTASDFAFVQVTPTFVNVQENEVLKLSDITFGEDLATDDSIQMFDENGDVVQMLTWTRTRVEGEWKYFWADIDGEEINDFDFPRGGSLWLSTESELDVTFAGQVATGVTVVPYGGDYAFCQTGNSTPVPVKLSQLTFGDMETDDSIQMFDENGDVVQMLTWTRTRVEGEWKYFWADIDGEEIEDYTFEPGQAFWISFANEGELTIPAAL